MRSTIHATKAKRDKQRKRSRAGPPRPPSNGARAKGAPASERLARLYAALSATNEAILRTQSPDALYQGVCDAAAYSGKFVAASILIADAQTGWLRRAAVAGGLKEILGEVRISVDETAPEGRGRGLAGTAYRTRTVCIANDFQNEERTRPWHAIAKRIGVVSAAAVPLFSRGCVRAIMFLCSRIKNDFDPETVTLLERMAANIAYALENLEHEAQQRVAEQRLRESEEKYRTILESIEDVYYEVDLHGNLVFANPAFARLLGRDLEIGRNNRNSQTPEMAAAVYRAFNDVYRTGMPKKSQEWEWVHQNGSHISVEGSVHLVRDASGKPIGFRGIMRDVTTRRQIEQRLRESEEKYRTILENIEDAYYEVDMRGALVFFNTAFSNMLGYPPEKLIGMNNREYQMPEVAAGVYKVFSEVRRTGIPTKAHVWKLTRNDGSDVWVEGSVQLVKGAGGQELGFRGILRDVTARREMEQALRESEARFRALTELSSDWYWEQDTAFRFTRIESRKGDQDMARKILLGKSGWEIGFEVDTDGGWEAHRAALKAHQPFRDTVMHWVAKDGKRSYISVSGEPVFGDGGRFLGYRGVTRVITEQKLAEERVQYLATHDALTDLPNRVMFSQLLIVAIESARRYGQKFAVLFLDLDRFKIINDTLGHEAGDILLKEMSARLKDCLRTSDVVARLGGDEFVVLLQKVDDSQQIAGVARKLLSTAMKPINVLSQECRITASIGICMYPEDGADEQSLMKNADGAMYLAKEEGKNNFQFYSQSIKTQSLEQLTLEANLRRALEYNEFSLHYQAKLNFKTGRITGVEALIRWQNAQLGSVSPAQFIPLAEETGLIVAIGRWVLRTACAQNVAWQRLGLPPISLAVNLSTRQFGDADLLKDIREALTESGMRADLLELEITEGMVTQNAERAVQLLAAIKNMGVRLAIDDFGTGYSSLAQLKRFPIDTLKIDRSFIREIPMDVEDKAITEAIIAMGKTLSLTVVAEGVDTQEQATFLREHACDEMQGYYFSKPIPPEQFAELLRLHTPLAPPQRSADATG
jgi:diguanylate cyclase (GGDEF)-like protein/PAS domain S-box-containing protein